MKIFLSVALALLLGGCGEDAPLKSVTTPKAAVQTAAAVEQTKPTNVAVVPRTIAPTPLKTGAHIYKKCSGCHGTDGSTQALGKSQVIKGWSSAKVEAALSGYRDGSYGGAMKALMKGQVTDLNEHDIKLVADHISKL